MPTLEQKEIIYPTRPVTMIVSSAAGSGMDLHARSMEALFEKYFNKGLVVVNRAGGSGIIGWNELTDSNPDGYTLGISANDLLIQPLLKSNKYHYPTALDPIAQLTTPPFILVISATSPHQTLEEIFSYSQKNTYRFKFGHPGNTSPPYILGHMIEKKANINFDYIPFKGGSEVLAALLGNHIQIACINPSVVKEQIRAGTLKALAITGDKRLADNALSNIPTLKELGIDIVLTNWYGVAAHKGLPPEVKAKLDKGFAQIVADPDFKRNMENLGLEVDYLNAADSQQKWIEESRKLKKWLTETGILEQMAKEKG